MPTTPIRGHVYRMEDAQYGTLYCLVLATDSAYAWDDSILAVRVTLAPAVHHFPGWVRMKSGDPTGGYVVVHDLDRVDTAELAEDYGPLSLDTLVEVEKALRRMLGI